MQCMRCEQECDSVNHPLGGVCSSCLAISSKLTTEEKTAMNSWDMIDSVGKVIKMVRAKEWSWVSSADCKYITVRIDMRDGGCIIKDRSGKRIGPDRLAFQYTKENQTPPNT